MPASLFSQIKHALKTLQPAEVRAEAERDVRIGLIASSSEVLGDMETFLAPAHLSPLRRAEAVCSLARGHKAATAPRLLSLRGGRPGNLRPPDSKSSSRADAPLGQALLPVPQASQL